MNIKSVIIIICVALAVVALAFGLLYIDASFRLGSSAVSVSL